MTGGSASRGVCIYRRSASGGLHLGDLHLGGREVCIGGGVGGWADPHEILWDTVDDRGTHSTGMHSCISFSRSLSELKLVLNFV